MVNLQNTSDFLLAFFRCSTEKEFNEKLGSQQFNHDAVVDYLRKVCNVPVEDYLQFIKTKHHNKPIGPKDVFQYSRIENATYNLCQILSLADNDCISAKELGVLLLPGGKKRGDNAYERYGYDHLRLADVLGLVVYQNKRYSLSAIGREFSSLDDNQKQKLLTRLILRTKLIMRLYKEYTEHMDENGQIEVETILYCLSRSTYIRRCPNIRGLLNVLLSSNEYSFESFYHKLKF